MKKLIVILMVLAVVAGFAFADDPVATPAVTVNEGLKRITLTSEVEEFVPQFVFLGTMNSDYETDAVEGNTSADDFDGTELDSKLSIADEDLQAYFIIIQNDAMDSQNQSQDYARYNNTITFTFDIGKLVEQNPNTDDDRVAKEVPGHLVAGSAKAAAAVSYTGWKENEQISLKNAILNSVEDQVFKSIYNGRVNNDQEIGRFSAIWYKDNTLPNGEYMADITLTIAVQ